jgi:hypothetical protein
VIENDILPASTSAVLADQRLQTLEGITHRHQEARGDAGGPPAGRTSLMRGTEVMALVRR